MVDIELNALPVRVYKKDLEGRFVYANDNCLEAHKVSSLSELLGKTDFDYFDNTLAAKWRDQELQLVQNGGALPEGIVEEHWLDGRKTWVKTTKHLASGTTGSTMIVGLSVDITESLQTLQRYQQAVDRHRDGVWQYDAATQDVWLSRQCYEMLGLPHDEVATFSVRQWLNQVHPDDRYLVNRAYASVTPADRFSQVDCRVRNSGNHYSLFRIRLTVDFDSEHRPIFVSGTISDRSEYVEQEASYKHLLDLVPSFIFVKDRDLRFEYANKAILDGFGLLEEEVIGKTDSVLITNQDQVAHFNNDDRRVLDGEEVRRPEEDFDHKKHGRIVLTTIKVPKPGVGDKCKPTGVVGVATDITELAEMRRSLEALIQHIPDGVFFKDRQHRFTRVNDAMARYLCGGRPEDCIGKTDSEFFASDLADAWRNEERDVFETGEAVLGDVRITKSSEGQQVRRVSKIPVLDWKGDVSSIVGITHDITPERRQQQELAEQKLLLERVIDTIPLHVALQDESGVHMLCNAAFANYFGIQEKACIAGKIFEDLIGDRDAVETLSSAFRAVSQTSDKKAVIDNYVETDRQGRRHQFRVGMYALQSEHGTRVLTVRDHLTPAVETQRQRLHKETQLLDELRREEDDERRCFLLLLGFTHHALLGMNRGVLFTATGGREFKIAFAGAIGQRNHEMSMRLLREVVPELESISVERCILEYDRRQEFPDRDLNDFLDGTTIRLDRSTELSRLIRHAISAQEVVMMPGQKPHEIPDLESLLLSLDTEEALVAIIPVREKYALVAILDNVRSRKHVEEESQGASATASIPEFTEFARAAQTSLSIAVQNAENKARESTQAAWRRLAANVSHSLGNILPFSQRALSSVLSGQTSRSTEKVLREVIHDIQRANALIIDFQRYSARPSTRRRVTTLRVFDLLDQIMRALLPEMVVFSTRDEEVDELWVQIDCQHLVHDCFRQLALNSLRHSEADDLRCELISTTVRTNESRRVGAASDRWVSIQFEDNGVGIPYVLKQRIFEPAFTTHDDGTGMGLPLAKSAVEENGGQLSEIGVPGEGACFRVVLPAFLTEGEAREEYDG